MNFMATIPTSIQDFLAKPYLLTNDQIEFYQKNRFIKLKQVFDEETISFFNEAISKRVDLMNHQSTPLEQRSTYGKAFLQLFNLWREDDVVKAFIFSERLARIATDLMQVDGVRIYHDQALFKEGAIKPYAVVVSFSDITAIKATNEKLEESEMLFRSFMTNSPTLAWVYDENGNYVYGNTLFKEVIGLNESHIGKHLSDISSPQMAENRFRARSSASCSSFCSGFPACSFCVRHLCRR